MGHLLHGSLEGLEALVVGGAAHLDDGGRPDVLELEGEAVVFLNLLELEPAQHRGGDENRFLAGSHEAIADGDIGENGLQVRIVRGVRSEEGAT